MKSFDRLSSEAASAKPMIGEKSSDFPTLSACPQSTPLVAVRACMNWLAMPTPMIEPISVCELEIRNPEVPGAQIPDNCRRQ